MSASPAKVPRVIPAPGTLPNAARDAAEAFAALKAGGVVILPTEVGYGIMSASAEGIERAFAAKQRRPGHTLGIIGTWAQHAQLHVLPADRFDMTRVATQELGQLLAVVAPFRREHPRLRGRLTAQTLERATRGDTLGIALVEGPLLTELGRLNDADGQLMVGSSANLSGAGQKFRVEDIEPEVRACADLIVDYGLQRYHAYGRAGTVMDMESLKVLRFGAGYEVFRHRMNKWFGLDLPEDPDWKEDAVQVGVSIRPDGDV